MATVFDSINPDGAIHLADEESGALVTVEPGRGGLITQFEVGGRPVLFMDTETLRDPSKNVRGGVPVLFPSPGKLRGDAWERAGQRGELKQHGFARNHSFRETGRLEGAIAALALRLDDSAETLARFPWRFSLELTVTLRGSKLSLQQRVTNRDRTAMPFGIGFHPYFAVSQADKAGARIETRARRAFDNVTKREIDLPAIDLSQPEVDLHLLDHGSTESALRWRGAEVRLRGSAEFTHWVVWTLAGRDFVCLEPWTCPGDALNTGDRLIVLPPGETRSLELEIVYSGT